MRGARAAGFTLVEFLVVMTVIAIVSVTALPSFDDFRARLRLRAAADNLHVDLQYARSEAVQRNAIVSVSFTPGT
ncbi:MAG TPA: GspH/FimT family pseudopilin, partial [Quisquiliibacterium sp.]|nr:GspH/FimT family pseudopilin [Quisquiliibacterium sp.]